MKFSVRLIKRKEDLTTEEETVEVEATTFMNAIEKAVRDAQKKPENKGKIIWAAWRETRIVRES